MIDERELASSWTDDWLMVMAARYTNGGIIMITVQDHSMIDWIIIIDIITDRFDPN